ncbi:hypothetical protein PG913_03720 [Tenacibaculum pacificus]|uniref:hypothetical protein n=1 Tax=Tenacibaculum pacificus TaxID=3018314 RepID=UPI0022F38AA6|nr:hypothetical protein [Tenacibaculum pacificus]WBX74322.1 hypothetical protein PG913_03720 [Tenacibaculum pacificus]
MINIIGIVLITVITAGLTWYSEVKSNERQKKQINGRYLLKANLVYKVLGFLFIIIGVILMNFIILNWNEEIKIIGPILICFFLIPGIFTVIFYYNYSIEFDELRIITTNWKGTKRTFKWSELINVKFFSSFKYLEIKLKFDKILINQDSTGFINFIEMMELQTDYTIEKLKIH